MANYEDNMYNWLKRRGYSAKYEHAGIYCIKIDNRIVYIGKSTNMLKRVAQHYVAIQKVADKTSKYYVLSAAKRRGRSINFDVLYDAAGKGYSAIGEEIGRKESELIRQYMPELNTQIPKEDNWRKYEVRHIDVESLIANL